jgi:hypothetical protein
VVAVEHFVQVVGVGEELTQFAGGVLLDSRRPLIDIIEHMFKVVVKKRHCIAEFIPRVRS